MCPRPRGPGKGQSSIEQPVPRLKQRGPARERHGEQAYSPIAIAVESMFGVMGCVLFPAPSPIMMTRACKQ
ncbi:unnamed protein product [Lota lota]